jgi:hypothetical protein
MPKDDFLLNLRGAASTLWPNVNVDGTRLSRENIEAQLRRATIWLTPKAVEGFKIADFPELESPRREELEQAVNAFRHVAVNVPDPGPASSSQVQEALPHFLKILEIMNPYVTELKVDHILRNTRFPAGVEDFVIKLGEDWTHDPAAFIWVIVSDELADQNRLPPLFDLEEIIRGAFSRGGIDLYPYVGLRTKSEQSELEQEVAG